MTGRPDPAWGPRGDPEGVCGSHRKGCPGGAGRCEGREGLSWLGRPADARAQPPSRQGLLPPGGAQGARSARPDLVREHVIVGDAASPPSPLLPVPVSGPHVRTEGVAEAEERHGAGGVWARPSEESGPGGAIPRAPLQPKITRIKWSELNTCFT